MIMEKGEWLRLAIAIVLGYGILFITMWLFTKSNKKANENEKSEQVIT